MFILTPRGPTSSDCTAPYEVLLDKEYTVETFINAVLTTNPDDWGHIGIANKLETTTGQVYGNPTCEYCKGHLTTDPLPSEVLSQTVASVKARGGYTLMDYLITLGQSKAPDMVIRPVQVQFGDSNAAWDFLNKDAEYQVFYSWTKTVQDETDPATTITTSGVFIIMKEFPVRQIYSLGSDASKSVASALINKDILEFSHQLAGAIVTTAALKRC